MMFLMSESKLLESVSSDPPALPPDPDPPPFRITLEVEPVLAVLL